jgi:hypothetical protein
MSLLLENYQDQQVRLPSTGQHLCAQFTADDIIVYQAYQPGIADYAVREQSFGGPHYSFSRMTWIKPGFMWMMYRAGWATKPNQERILAIRLKLDGFLAILEAAVHSSFQKAIYQDQENWQEALSSSGVRLQWDPDHDPHGNKLDRRAIQIGLKGEWVQRFNWEWILEIMDVTNFAKQQYSVLSESGLEGLEVPVENVFPLDQYPLIQQRLGAD